MADEGGVERRDDHTAPLAVAHEALGLQQPQCLQHGLARNIETRGQLVLGDALAGHQLAIANRIEDGPVDAIGERQMQ
jgi:hypothetical protein